VAVGDGAGPLLLVVRLVQAGAVAAGERGGVARTAGGAGRRADEVATVVHADPADLDTGDGAVLDEAGFEVGTQVGLVDPTFIGRVAALRGAEHRAVHHVAGAVVRVGDDVVEGGAAHPGGVGDGQAVVEVMLEGEGGGIGRALAEIATAQTVEIVAIGAGGLAHTVGADAVGADQRNAVVRHVVRFQMVVGQGRTGGSVEAAGDGRRHAPAADADATAPGAVGLVLHQVAAAGDLAAGLVVAGQGGAAGLAAAEAVAQVREVVALGGLADQVRAAAGGGGAGRGRTRALGDFH